MNVLCYDYIYPNSSCSIGWQRDSASSCEILQIRRLSTFDIGAIHSLNLSLCSCDSSIDESIYV